MITLIKGRIMMKNNCGYTLIELILVLSILGIILTLANPINLNFYHDTSLKNLAEEVRSAKQMAQQLSIDESRSYRFEIVDNTYRIRENFSLSEVVFQNRIPRGIEIESKNRNYVVYSRSGTTNYLQLTFRNQRGKRVQVETLIATGRVQINYLD
ncbi:prepilin-type N-terminal cleavage/methylation domain-containing protein [Serpentinicella sp. ANB-PHB4]|uniref:prepilin-type N-terminal cleavage/methylation domain-containing protein n=1 Tax=Serpentinicella sp. ANB-PHB4 TaxID=3074076 RepID=UPI00286221C4|nr:prepilin-type N-terminal cleavage/methylation domain-containing protein [Serpentinicella sp. ANB-PHB4]MDR5658209.1 prepilin-type N-terminal cleavage/methylation domain-containing protein [Serpentinicella sp. ANB-PHB4]